MNINKQVTTLEQSKKLKELGIIQTGLFTFVWNGAYIDVDGNKGFILLYQEDEIDLWDESYSAFTVAELGIMLGIVTNGISYDDEFNVWFTNWGLEFIRRFETEASAKAALLIHMLENGLMDTGDINERLRKLL